jgi:hypothetical protein
MVASIRCCGGMGEISVIYPASLYSHRLSSQYYYSSGGYNQGKWYSTIVDEVYVACIIQGGQKVALPARLMHSMHE